MKTRNLRLALSCATLLLAASVQSYAGGPLALRDAGAPFRWPNGGLNIPWNPDQGNLGFMTNAQAVAQTAAAFQTWADIPSASATHQQGAALPVDVDETNFLPYLEPAAPDGLSAIVYDNNGEIFELLFGPNSGVLGFASPEWVNTTTGDITEGVAFMNGAEVTSPADIPVFQAVQVHEFGHYQNLAHSVVNGQIAGFGDNSGPTPNDTFPVPSMAGKVETMYPFLFAGDAGGAVTPHADDIAIFSHLYPAPTFPFSTGTISGSIFAPNGTTPLTGVNVIARNVLNPYDDAVSAISSDFADDYTPGQPFVGTYTLRGLTPGATYAVYVDEILAGGFSTPPLNPLPNVEELYNGPNESSNSATDNPAAFTPVTSIAGVNTNNINIIFNKLTPGPIPVGDDSSVQLFPPFPVEMCGQRFDSLFVNGNGNVTFGGGDEDFSESPGEHLRGLPRLAGLWDDLDPSSGGTVSFSETATTFTVTFSGVPEFNTTNSNTFSIKLFKKIAGPLGNAFRLQYGGLDATDGLAGYSCGGRVTSGFERETDLEEFRHLPLIGLFETAIYENFNTADNDLDNKTIQFLGTFEPEDLFENNNTRAKAHRVDLPFNSSSRLLHTEIEPTGGDVDYFKFRGKAGEIFVAETVPGLPDMDTILGLFNSSGALIAADDDGGAGLLSRLAVTLPANGDYYVAVSTFPDVSFTGAGEDFGRYVLTMNSYTGTLLPLTDDDSVQVPLNTFTFPYQGANRTSVFVNGNGNLTFGAADGDLSESVAEFLNGPPRIAPLWDDLFPADGLVIAEEKNKALYIHFVTVPEFFSDSPNYFTVVLDKKGDITMDYGATSRSDGLVGVTKGGGAADPGPRNLSSASNLSAVGTTYEQFLGSPFNYGGVDLSFQQLKFKK